MAEPAFTIEQVVAATRAALEAPESEELRKQAERYLNAFQASNQAWMLSDQMLRLPEASPVAFFFAAQTLRTKLRYDFRHLPGEAHAPLRQALLNHLQRFKAGPKDVRGQLCSAVGLAAMHMASEWPDAVKTVVETLGGDAASTAALLETLAALPVEGNAKQVDVSPAARETFQHNIEAAAPQVLQLLAQLMPSAQTVDAQLAMLECVREWAYFGHVPAADMAASPLLPAVFSALNVPQLYDGAVDAIEVLLRAYNSTKHHMPVLTAMFARIMALAPRLAARLAELSAARAAAAGGEEGGEGDDDVVEEPDDELRGLCRLLCELGESVVESLLGECSPQQLDLLNLIAQCTCAPQLRVARSTLPFWYRLNRAVSRVDAPAEEGGNRAGVEALRRTAQPVLAAVVKGLIRHCALPAVRAAAAHCAARGACTPPARRAAACSLMPGPPLRRSPRRRLCAVLPRPGPPRPRRRAKLPHRRRRLSAGLGSHPGPAALPGAVGAGAAEADR